MGWNRGRPGLMITGSVPGGSRKAVVKWLVKSPGGAAFTKKNNTELIQN